ncbi:winged helix-turn-helix transcriptional regulator [bacterium]|nr:winged helix-turn-helix transcriptional regulator [bacterium]
MIELDECKKMARILKALAHPTRLRIVVLLSRDVSCVDALRTALNLKQPNISQHLAILRGAQLVTFRREGNRVCYSLADENLPIVIALLGSCGADDIGEDPELERLLDALRGHFSNRRKGGRR